VSFNLNLFLICFVAVISLLRCDKVLYFWVIRVYVSYDLGSPRVLFQFYVVLILYFGQSGNIEIKCIFSNYEVEFTHLIYSINVILRGNGWGREILTSYLSLII